MCISRPEKPFLGDIYFPNGAPEGDWRFSKETNFEVWDGSRWVHGSEANKLIYNIQVTEP